MLQKYYSSLKKLEQSNLKNYIIMRSDLKRILHNFFQENNFIHVDRPVLTRFIRDISKSTFYLKANYKPDEMEAFTYPVYLNPSGQLHLEVINSSFNKVYSIMPCFDLSLHIGNQLKEFWAVECEQILPEQEGLSNLTSFVENAFKKTIRDLLHQNMERQYINQTRAEMLLKMVQKPFHHISFDEAINILSRHSPSFKEHYTFLTRPNERFLVKYFGNSPIFVTKHPYFLYPFNNARLPEDPQKVQSFVLLVPEFGELASGGIREHKLEQLVSNLTEYCGVEYFSWFTKLKSWGCCSSGGFSLGFDRLIMFISGEELIQNVIPFPRKNNFCPC